MTKFVATTLGILVLDLGFVARAVEGTPPHGKNEAAKVAAEEVTLTNQLVDGKKTWSPLDVTVHAGQMVKLDVVNTLAEPHGFKIADQVPPVEVVVPAKSTKVVEFTPAKAGTFKISCQLHPAHVAGNLVVKTKDAAAKSH